MSIAGYRDLLHGFGRNTVHELKTRLMRTTRNRPGPDSDTAADLLKPAAWIWTDAAARPYQNVVCFVREFETSDATSGTIHITADSGYELYVNGCWVGQGPPRSWLSPWPVDRFSVSHLLRAGRNRIAVLVQHLGLGTFRYLHSAPGLLARSDVKDSTGVITIVTNNQWSCLPHAGYGWPVPRISCMQGWEEQFDARVSPGRDWLDVDESLVGWRPAIVIAEVGQGGHDRLELRTDPPLTQNAIAPLKVHSIEAVRPASFTWTVNPRDLLNPLDKTANQIRGRMLLATHIYSDVEQPIEVHQPHDRPNVPMKLNGRPLAFDDLTLQKTGTGVAHAQLQAGWNTLMARLPEVGHYWWMTVNVWVRRHVRWSARPIHDGGPPWLAIGPFEFPPKVLSADGQTSMADVDLRFIEALHLDPAATADRFESVWDQGTFDLSDLAPVCRSLTSGMVATTDVFALSASDRPVPHADALLIKDPDAVLLDDGSWSTVLPPLDAADVRVLLDFGDEVIGRHEFEVDAPAGTIIDVHNFEFIQQDGRYNLAEGMNNSFRYTCREGVQRYRTLVRRGFRYSWLTFRALTGPLRMRHVRLLMSTYPQQRQGAFACADPLLDRIWQAGAHTVACCSEDTYTDCPTYEQTFWVGDGRNEAMVDLVANGDPRLSAHSWKVAARSLDRSPLVESQVPSAWENVLPAWSFLWMRWAQEHYHLSGDRSFGEMAMPYLARNIDGIEQHLSERGLFRFHGWNMFDWASMDTPADGEITHLNCLAVLGLRQAAQMATELNHSAQSRHWLALADGISEAVNRHMWDAGAEAYIDCIHVSGRRSTVFSQQTNTVAHIAGVAQGQRAERCWQIMTSPPPNVVEAGSPFFMFFLLEALAARGDGRSLQDTICSYWGRQIEAGATTFWETYTVGQTRLTRSHCHGWSAAPTVFLTQHVLGVRPSMAGYDVIDVCPLTGRLAWARGRVPTPKGVIDCGWEQLPDRFTLQLSLPPGTRAVIRFPFDGEAKIHHGEARRSSDADGGFTWHTKSPSISFDMTRR